MKNLSVIVKMVIIGILVVLFMVFSISFSVSSMQAINTRILQEEEDNIRKDYDVRIQQQVEQVISLLDCYQADIEAGVYSKEEGMKRAADAVRQLRYGTDGYFWVDQSDGVNVVLLGNDTEGTNRLGTKDVTGFEMVKDFIQGAVKNGSIIMTISIREKGVRILSQREHIRSIMNPLTGLSEQEIMWIISTIRLRFPPRRQTSLHKRKLTSLF